MTGGEREVKGKERETIRSREKEMVLRERIMRGSKGKGR